MEPIYEQTTICAQATPQGEGAIAIIRISGPRSIEILSSIFENSGKSALKTLPHRKMAFGTISDSEGNVIDEVLAAAFAGPHSYTGEDSAEIYCHGSEYIVSELIKLLMSKGVKLAEAGEFTKRAFLNGKLDLAQAEAVADLISSETKAAHDIAMNQMKGGYSDELKEMREELLHIVSLMELELDFSEEDVEFADRGELRNLLEKVSAHIKRLLDSFALGNVIKNGVPVAIVGATNTGKSTLLNAILHEERAIVSDIAGTTRDTIEDTVNIDGVTFRFIDTAGIRSTKETIEIIGIKRTYSAIGKASDILMLLDAERPEYIAESLANLAPRLHEGQELIILLNKTDLIEGGHGGSIGELLAEIEISVRQNGLSPVAVIPISAKKHIGIDKLFRTLVSSRKSMVKGAGTTLVTNLRHYEALKDAMAALERVGQGLDEEISTEFVVQDIREALYHIGTITGEVSSEEILGDIFKNFCIGK